MDKSSRKTTFIISILLFYMEKKEKNLYKKEKGLFKMDNRTYMTIIGEFYNWCFERRIDVDNIDNSVIEKYISLHKEKTDIIKEALDRYFSYF